jgi:hypothetical protein
MSDHLLEKPDPLVPDPRVAEEFGVSLMTLWRWDHDPRMAELGWEPPVKIRKRNYRSRSVLEKVKAAAMKIGIARLKATPAPPLPPRKAKVTPSTAERTSERTPVNAALESRIASNTSDAGALLPKSPGQPQQKPLKSSKASNVPEEPVFLRTANNLDRKPR